MRPKEKENAYFSYVSTKKIKPSKLNPRRIFDPEKISELAASFTEHGMIQPIIISRNGSYFVILCGERRWLAAKRAKLTKIPAIVHPKPPKDEIAVSMALIENLHRQDIDLVSESSAIRNLIENYGWPKSKVAKDLGVSSGYIRNRFLLTKFSDVLENFDKGKISFSEAIELSSIKDDKIRNWFFQRLVNDEFDDFKSFSKAVGRFKYLKKAIDQGHFLSQPLTQSLIQFDVQGLPCCDQSCKYYLRQTWEEKKFFGLSAEKPGWSEYCTAINNGCYSKKRGKRQKYYKSLQMTEVKRPILFDGWESMLWFKYKRKMCKTCKHMVDSVDFEAIGQKPEPGIYAYCTDPESTCYDKRCDTYIRMGIKREKIINARKEERKKQILKQISTNYNQSGKSPKSYITKAECAYLILQFICHAGGKSRLENFAKKYSFDKNMPLKYNVQVKYIKNKLVDKIKEDQLLDILFIEAAICAAYSPQNYEPLQFNRNDQKEFPIIVKAT